MNLTGTLLDKSYHHKWIGQGAFCTHEVSENDVDIDTFRKKQTHNCSVIGSLLDTKLLTSLFIIQMKLIGTLLDKSNHHKWIWQGPFWTQMKSQQMTLFGTFGNKLYYYYSVIGFLLDKSNLPKWIY